MWNIFPRYHKFETQKLEKKKKKTLREHCFNNDLPRSYLIAWEGVKRRLHNKNIYFQEDIWLIVDQKEWKMPQIKDLSIGVYFSIQLYKIVHDYASKVPL